MELTPAQVKRFKELHEQCGGLENYTDDQIREIANGVASIFLTLFKINQRIKKEEKQNEETKSKN